MKLKTVIGIGGLLLCAASAMAQAPAREAMCQACHGAQGAKPIMELYPKLNGQNKAYLVSALKAYRAGERKGGMAGVMGGQAASLSDDDINALAEYYSKQ